MHLYEELGEQVIEALNGMFALAIWDGPARRLLLARDRLGQKPLYYHWDGERLVFASRELKGVMAAPWVPRERSESALDAYLTFGYVPSPSTIYRGVGKLRPGHIMVFDEANVRTRRYWDLAFRNDGAPLSIDDAVDRCDEMVGEATRCRLVSEVPLGAFLSGGVDSSLVVAHMQRCRRGPSTDDCCGIRQRRPEWPYWERCR